MGGKTDSNDSIVCIVSFLYVCYCVVIVLFLICNIICCLPAVSVCLYVVLGLLYIILDVGFVVPCFYVAMLPFGWVAIVAGELLSQRFSGSDGRPSKIKHGLFSL